MSFRVLSLVDLKKKSSHFDFLLKKVFLLQTFFVIFFGKKSFLVGIVTTVTTVATVITVTNDTAVTTVTTINTVA